MKSAAVVTTFGNDAWNVYAQTMLRSYVANWPQEIPLLVGLDDNALEAQVNAILRPQDACRSGFTPEQEAFVKRNKGKDDPQDYRKQAVRFCHKVFTLKHALNAINDEAADNPDSPKVKYLIWLDADVFTTKQVTFEMLDKCMPKEGDAVAYMGRKDWPHSECGWLVYDLENGGEDIINAMVECYISDKVFTYEQWDDSWIFDQTLKSLNAKATNLTLDKPGTEIWQHSHMAEFSTHHKGPLAKQKLVPVGPSNTKTSNGQTIRVQTRNSIPDDKIKANIEENQKQIKNWIGYCAASEEEITIVSAGPTLIGEDLLNETNKIVAVKHALQPLKDAGVKPWACILLDPRDHVNDFVQEPDKDIIWFVASQVTPSAVKTLLDAGCTVWGYHAAVGACEDELTALQPDSIISGGSATATRGMFMLNRLGFNKFKLYGYDLCLTTKPNMDEKDEFGQPRYFEVTIDANHKYFKGQQTFWTKGELIAQYEEFNQIIQSTGWDIEAHGNGIVPFMTKALKVNNLRHKREKSKLKFKKYASVEDMLGCKTQTKFWHQLPKLSPLALRKAKKANS